MEHGTAYKHSGFCSGLSGAGAGPGCGRVCSWLYALQQSVAIHIHAGTGHALVSVHGHGYGHAPGLVIWSGHLVMLPVTVTVRLFASGCRTTGCFSVIR